MSIGTFLEEAKKNHYQPYYACYLYCFNLPMGHSAESNAKYIRWIGQRHEEFKPMAKHLNSGKYFYEFMDYLKNYVEERRIKTAST